jgi:iron complex outermembrane recepter protein
MYGRRISVYLFLLAACLPLQGIAASEADRLETLDALSLEKLLEIPVTLASRKTEARREAAAAIHVITAEDIARSAARTLPELLRYVPGVNVARQDVNKYAISIRGFNGRFSNKLLVMIDGRSIYTPDFSGVWWDHHDIPLENIARIEIIRGPGGALWGANAVNGVINIQTKSAAETHGGMLRHRWSTDAPAHSMARWGAAIREDLHYRLTLSYAHRNESEFAGGDVAEDNWETGRIGTRFDWTPDEDTELAFDADLFHSRAGQSENLIIMPPPWRFHTEETEEHIGGHVRGRLRHAASPESQWELQFSADHSRRDALQLLLARTTYNLEIKNQYRIAEWLELIWGGDVRYSHAAMDETLWVAYDRKKADDWLLSGFFSFDMRFLEDRLRLDAGTKLEYNNYSGFETQPSLRLAWIPGARHMAWGAISRAVRTPSFLETEGRINAFRAPLLLGALTGNRDFDSEELLAFEIGYRYTASENLAFDLALFENHYDGLRIFGLYYPRFELLPFPPHILFRFRPENRATATVRGFELAVDAKPLDWWLLRGSWSLAEIDMAHVPAVLALPADDPEGDAPQQQAALHSRMDLPCNTAFDAVIAWADKLPALDIDSYWDLNLRLAWRPHEDLEIALAGHHLLDRRRSEFKDRFVNLDATTVERAFSAGITWEF